MRAERLPIDLDHVQITIPIGAEHQARMFYCTALGLIEIRKPESLASRGGFWLQLGKVQLHVGTEPEWDRSQTKAHVAYRVDDLESWRARLMDFGCVIEESIPIPGHDRFETRDPFGNRIEFISKQSET
jgi:catechol 2,3-dioxygenase-like lactoylglutathione lyase family enzyme